MTFSRHQALMLFHLGVAAIVGGALVLAAGAAAADPDPKTGITRIAANLYFLDIDEFENKVVIAEFGKYVVAIESPQNDAVADTLLHTVDRAFPGKPLRYLFHTHPHRHSIAGVDPYLRRAVTIVTSPANLPAIQEATRDTLALAAHQVLVDSTMTLRDRQNEMTAYLIRRSEVYTVPTAEYMVFYFPRQQTLVSGCLYNKPLTYHEVVNVRKPAIRKFIADHSLDVEYLIPTNTDRKAGFEDVCTLAMLDETLVKGMHPDSVALSLRRMPLEEIEAKRDSLKAHFGELVPRSFDLNVCANTLIDKYGDAHRGMQLLKITTGLFPNDGYAYQRIGECYRQKQDYLEAVAYFTKALGLAREQSRSADAQAIEKTIAETTAAMAAVP